MNEKDKINTISIKANEQNGIASIKMLIRHPMETGQRKDEDGNLIALNYINKVSILGEDNQIIFLAHWGPSIAKDPIMAIRTKMLKKGDKFTIVWQTHDGKEQKQSAQVE